MMLKFRDKILSVRGHKNLGQHSILLEQQSLKYEMLHYGNCEFRNIKQER